MAGAVVAKKKMMKKYGWYKHSEDGGTELSFSLIFKCIAYQTIKQFYLFLNYAFSPFSFMQNRIQTLSLKRSWMMTVAAVHL